MADFSKATVSVPLPDRETVDDSEFLRKLGKIGVSSIYRFFLVKDDLEAKLVKLKQKPDKVTAKDIIQDLKSHKDSQLEVLCNRSDWTEDFCHTATFTPAGVIERKLFPEKVAVDSIELAPLVEFDQLGENIQVNNEGKPFTEVKSDVK